ncbi:hypothetical protein BDW74DRAFT_189486 [Aspergillus multicolor]|uniref:fungal specific transcription factor domain-containing protein n=1 Tax=Aspergillus multicolor TaxID=41759 RepID=UPI003CCDBABE
MISLPRTGSVGVCGDDKLDRVQRACDRCNNSRTRCKLGYACQYKRTVKKRGPKPKSQLDSQNVKRDVETGARPTTYPSPKSTSSEDAPWLIDRPSVYTGSDGNADAIDPDALSCTSEVCSNLDVFGPLGANMASFVALEANIPICGHFPLDLSPFPIPFDSGNSNSSCRYPCLVPVIPLLQGTMTADDACELLDIFFSDPETAGAENRCPYVLSPVIKKQSVLMKRNPRPASAAFLVVILWCVSHTTSLAMFRDPTARTRVTQRLYYLSMKLLRARDSDICYRADSKCPPMLTQQTSADASMSTANSGFTGGWVAESDMPLYATSIDTTPSPVSKGKPEQNVDDVLTYVLLTCVISGTEFKDEWTKWWSKAVGLVKTLGFNSEARITGQTPSFDEMSLTDRESHEERRRTFWLVYALDRHFAFSFNEPIHILDSECQVLCPLPEWVWQSLHDIPSEDIPPRVLGPPTQIHGSSFFEWFLPLMTILGDVIEVRTRNQHPRLGGFNESYLAAIIQAMLDDCEYNLEVLQAARSPVDPIIPGNNYSLILPTSPTCFGDPAEKANTESAAEGPRMDTAVAYSKYIIQFQRFLLSADCDARATGERGANCNLATSTSTLACSPTIFAIGKCVARILEVDTQLSFIPFVFGTYLFHGGLRFLSLSEQMPRVGARDLGSVQAGCEAIGRAHETILQTLDTSFQLSPAHDQWSQGHGMFLWDP